MPILWGHDKGGPFAILEGNKRLIAYTAGARAGIDIPVLIGLSSMRYLGRCASAPKVIEFYFSKSPRACHEYRRQHEKWDAMGEAKRRRTAIENGPCPCGSAKPRNMCCYNEQVWHKPPAVLGLRALPPKSAVTKCYMKELGSCDGGISDEHLFSESIMLLLKGDGDF